MDKPRRDTWHIYNMQRYIDTAVLAEEERGKVGERKEGKSKRKEFERERRNKKKRKIKKEKEGANEKER